jgi:hypothetical protein
MKQTIIAALITGLFTIAAGVGTYWFTKKEPALTYSVVGGPVLPGAGIAKQIYVIDVRNTGKKEVANVLAEVKLSVGKIEESASETSPGLRLREERKDTSFSVSADVLNPGEYVKLSLLLSSQLSEFKPSVVVRAPGVNASLLGRTTDTPRKEQLPIFLAAIAATLSVLVGASPLVRRFIQSSGLTRLAKEPLDQNEIVAYICAKAGLDDESEKFRFSSAKLSYRGAADFLMLRALKADQAGRKRYVAALKAMLLIDGVIPTSKKAMKRSIWALVGPSYDEASLDSILKKAVNEGNDPAGLRDEIDKLLATELG